jgi:hypothetical protein
MATDKTNPYKITARAQDYSQWCLDAAEASQRPRRPGTGTGRGGA